MTINTSLLISYFKKRAFQFVSKQPFTYSSAIFNKDSEINLDSKRTPKVTVVRKSIPVNKDSISVLECKPASSVLKKLNWENKCMYGPLQSSKLSAEKQPKIYGSRKIEGSDTIIQHETQIPIIEPLVKHISHAETHKSIDKVLDIEALLTFPLLNKFISENNNIQNKTEEWNILRKNLECLNKKFPSVSAILEQTMPKERIEILERWKQNMIKQLGEEGFQKYKRDLFANGSSLHSSINSYLASTSESELIIKEENKGHWKSLKKILPNMKDVKLLEEFVTHPFLCYRGVVDCFARYKDHLVVIDWKTSKKTKANIKNTYDNPLQIAAYVGALNFDPKYQYLASKGLIVVAYESGMPATVHFINEIAMLQYWNEWLQRVKQFWEMKSLEVDSS